MLNDNIRNLRKQKGYTQDTLAQELNVVRQTVSKWEKGYSVPDALMLEKIAELFEVSVSDLLGDAQSEAQQKTDLTQLSAQLSVLNNQIARELARKKKIRKILLIIPAIFIVILIAAAALSFLPNKVIYSETYTQAEISKELDKAVSDAIIKNNSQKDWRGECPTESHYIYGVDETEDGVAVYLNEDFNSFGFVNGFFIPVGASFCPAVYKFRKDGDKYIYVDCRYAEDGEYYEKSIKEMFSASCARHALSGISADENNSLWINCVKQAQAYLVKTKRNAQISDYSDIKHILLSDLGISDEVCNKLCDSALPYDMEIGNHEVVENGIRYVYQTECDGADSPVKFIKFRYKDNKIVEYKAFDGLTGEEIKNPEKPDSVTYYHGKYNDTNVAYTTVVYYD
ncbi:MAG: helix-turn-helix domain-containing protein [Clostridia bacterium]|nr:helix-turn-helix domain-containing protein [Clostridia bacterium]